MEEAATWLDTSCRVEPAYSSMHGPYNVTQMSGPSRTDLCGAISNHQCGHGRWAELRVCCHLGPEDDRARRGAALQVMHLTLARILQAFELKTHSNVGVDLEECSGILLSMMHPLQLDTNVGKDRLVEESDIPNLKYLQALIKETLRMYPVGPLLVPHETMEDCHVAGYFVPRGTGLFINAWTIQRDANVRAEPDRFRRSDF
ncbi:hypothetical protein Scep_003686 [Stephania cephalantha]|uniref:Cytochrome P450 n=1 Tax=Stephania cephalantha TaxID=152367 RepID=A0AAP0KSY0_9MAGN